MSDLTRQIATALAVLDEEDRVFAEIAADIEAKGFRIVDGGSTTANKVAYTDWRTGELLWSGTYRAHERRGWPDNWWHVDRIREGCILRPTLVEGLPESLARMIAEWAQENADEAGLFMQRSADA